VVFLGPVERENITDADVKDVWAGCLHAHYAVDIDWLVEVVWVLFEPYRY
jgi:hypothetical protein